MDSQDKLSLYNPVFKTLFALNYNHCWDLSANMKSGQRFICQVSARDRPVITLSCNLSMDPWCPLAVKWLVTTSVACTKVQLACCGHCELRKRINTLQIQQVQPLTKEFMYLSILWIGFLSVSSHSRFCFIWLLQKQVDYVISNQHLQ